PGAADHWHFALAPRPGCRAIGLGVQHQVHLQAMAGAFVLLLLMLTVWFAYLLAGLWQGRRHAGWPLWRLASFTTGSALLVVALCPPLTSLGPIALRVHMAQHLMLGMFAPIALMLGKLVTLLLRSVPATVACAITALLGSLPARLLTHPV